jgi:hypothetical protein
MPNATLETIRSYEILSAVLFVIGLIYVWRARSPLYFGAFLAAAIGGGVFEWIYDSKYYFRLVADNRFIPAWTMDGVKAPLAMILFYAFFFGIPLMITHKHYELLKRRFGPRGLYVFLAILGSVGTLLFEFTNTSVTEIYKYRQAPTYLLWGLPWSNLWFGALMFVIPYWGLRKAGDLVALQAEHQKAIDGTAKGDPILATALGFSAVITGFFVASVINGVWYVFAEPWISTTRPF